MGAAGNKKPKKVTKTGRHTPAYELREAKKEMVTDSNTKKK